MQSHETKTWITQLEDWARKYDISEIAQFCDETSLQAEEVLLNLQTLDLSNKQLSTLPHFLYNLTGLETLNLSHNALVEIDPQIANLTKLTHLDLSRNQLETLPREIANLKSLEVLNISWNHIVELPEFLFSIENLKLEKAWNRQKGEAAR